jgi:hypothetical protein
MQECLLCPQIDRAEEGLFPRYATYQAGVKALGSQHVQVALSIWFGIFHQYQAMGEQGFYK